MTCVLETKDVSRRLPDPDPVTLVDAVTMSVQPGEFLAIVGPSGCGKSSLLYLLGLIDRPTRGEVLIQGRETAGLSERERSLLRLEQIGLVFQFHFLIPEFTAAENVALPMRRLGRLSPMAVRRRTDELLSLVGLDRAGDGAQTACPAESASGWRSRGPWPMIRPCCFAMNRPAISTAPTPRSS